MTDNAHARRDAPHPPPSAGTVIIPAHNEAAVIARTLAPLAACRALDVIVVANGCTDDTAGIAARFDGVRVLELGPASKPTAMNAGDDVATSWPRLYLDADIEITVEAVLAVFARLGERGVLAARPSARYDTADASAAVRGYYRARSRIPGPPTRLWGAGGYATNEAGHARFGRFAEVTADDSWFDERFTAQEKRVVSTPPMRIRTPRDVPALLAVLARQRRGYVELGVAADTAQRGRALLRTVRGPRSAFDTACYVLLTLAARRRSARTTGAGTARWERDGSSRAIGVNP